MENGFKVVDPPLYEKVAEKPKLYRVYAWLHLLLMLSFLGYRLLNPLDEYYGIWILAFFCELWFSFQWILECNLRWLLVHYKTYPERLACRYSGESSSKLPPVDIVITTSDPFKEPAIMTANTVLSVLAIDYPVQKFACYVSDDGASPITFYGLVETLRFAKKWVPFCRKFDIETRAPFLYFSKESPHHGKSFDSNFHRERQEMEDEYEDLRSRITKALETQEVPSKYLDGVDGFAQGSSDVRNHSSVVKARVSGMMTNAPFICNLDCDMFVNSSKVIKHAMCFFLDCKSERECGFVQFPQVFHGGIKDDPFGNQLRIYLSTMTRGMNGLQGPPYCGTGCFHRRKALYGVPPATDQHYNNDVREIRNNSKVFHDLKASSWSLEAFRSIFGTSSVLSTSAQTIMRDAKSGGRSSPLLALDESLNVSGCSYETNTGWGKETSEPAFAVAVALFVSTYGFKLWEYRRIDSSIKEWWNNQRMWIILCLSSWVFGMFGVIMKLIGVSETVFVVTPKGSEGDDECNEGDFTFDSSSLFIPPTTVLLINLVAIVSGTGLSMAGKYDILRGKLFTECFCSVWVVINLLPFVKGLVRKGKRGIPRTVVIKSAVLALLLCCFWRQN